MKQATPADAADEAEDHSSELCLGGDTRVPMSGACRPMVSEPERGREETCADAGITSRAGKTLSAGPPV
jgi:hypothetical protein